MIQTPNFGKKNNEYDFIQNESKFNVSVNGIEKIELSEQRSIGDLEFSIFPLGDNYIQLDGSTYLLAEYPELYMLLDDLLVPFEFIYTDGISIKTKDIRGFAQYTFRGFGGHRLAQIPNHQHSTPSGSPNDSAVSGNNFFTTSQYTYSRDVYESRPRDTNGISTYLPCHRAVYLYCYILARF